MNRPCTIEIVDDLMVVLDDNGDGYDGHTFTTLDDAMQQLKPTFRKSRVRFL
jgi:hypothetical protein